MRFKLTEEQEKKFDDWIDSHERVYTGAIGGRYSITFHLTGVGHIIKAKDLVTDEELDLTDYDRL
jgi:hypothetical protein